MSRNQQVTRLLKILGLISNRKQGMTVGELSSELDVTSRTIYRDFEVRFQNSVGQPTIEVTCTCEIEEGYNEYFPDEVQCGCESTESDGLCLQYWEKL